MKNKLILSRTLSAFVAFFIIMGVANIPGLSVGANAFENVDAISYTIQNSESNPFADSDNAYSEALSDSIGSSSATDFSMSSTNIAGIDETARAGADAQPLEYSDLNFYNLKFKSECSQEEIYELIKNYEFNVIGRSSNKVFSIASVDDFDTIRAKFDTFCVYIEQDVELSLDQMASSANIDTLSAAMVETSEINDPELDRQWYLDTLDVHEAWSISTGSSSVYVAVIDSGIDRTHPDLINADIRDGYDLVREQAVAMDYAGHGTSVSGIIVAAMNNGIGISGISPDVVLIPLCVEGFYGDISSATVSDAIYLAADVGCKVINISLGGNSSYTLETAIEYANARGCIVVASAGNDGNSRYNYPASYDSVISVGSIDEALSRSNFSNYNDKLDVVAPGENIYTTEDSYFTGYDYGYNDGTSFSAPCVSAIAALVVSCSPNVTPAQFNDMLKLTCIDLGSQGYDTNSGYGLVSASALLQFYSFEKVSYQTHVQDIGWQGYFSNGLVSGTSGQSKRLEAIRIKLENIAGGIEYRTHVQDIGWQGWVANDQLSGTSGQSKRLEAIQVRLTGAAATNYDVYYRVHAENTGWLDWAKNGQSAGTAGYSYRLEAIQIKLVEKNGAAPGSTTRPFIERVVQPINPSAPTVLYRTHVQDVGWQAYVSNGAMSGTSGQSKRLEAIQIKLSNVAGGIEYSTHVQDIGWMGFVANDALSGTSGQSKRLEAIQIRLTGEANALYDVYYRVHAQDTGWLDWAKNGQAAGTAGFSYRLEGIEIKLVTKGGPAPGSTNRPFAQG